MAQPAVRILLGDDHQLFRHGIRKILESRPEWHVIAEASDGREVVSKTLEMRPDLVILDISLPHLSGIEATHQIARYAPETRVLIVSMYADDAYVAQALQAGAAGYLLKDSAGHDLVDAVSAVMAGTSFFSPRVARIMLDDYVRHLQRGGEADRYDQLSEREREVFQLVAEGKSSKGIAEVLGISPATVETHRAKIMDKLNLRNTAELVLLAVRRGLLRY